MYGRKPVCVNAFTYLIAAAIGCFVEPAVRIYGNLLPLIPARKMVFLESFILRDSVRDPAILFHTCIVEKRHAA